MLVNPIMLDSFASLSTSMTMIRVSDWITHPVIVRSLSILISVPQKGCAFPVSLHFLCPATDNEDQYHPAYSPSQTRAFIARLLNQ